MSDEKPGSESETLPEAVLSVPRSVADVSFAGIEVGTVVGESYRILGRLGEGAMGVVRLARDEQLDRLVAVKLVTPERLSGPAARQSLRAEARAMASVKHPNVVVIHAFGEHEGTPYFVMEYVPGMDLETYVRGRGGPPLQISEAMAVLRELFAGVRAIHEAGAVHGDLKPSNILMGEDGRVLVADLGLARFLSELNEGATAEVVGTPLYMAPELLYARAPNPGLATRIDVYSLACIAYELLTGRPPFRATNDIPRLLNMHATTPPAPPTSVAAHLPVVFDNVLLAALQKDPALRTASVSELAAQLEEAVAQLRPGGTGLRIVLLDDDEDFLAFACAGIEKAFGGAAVEAYTDPQAAIAAIREGVSAALIDLEMPEVNGLEVLASLRAVDEDTPIAVVTGVGGARDWAVLSELGASAFVVKPVEPEELARVVRQLLDRASLRPPAARKAPDD